MTSGRDDDPRDTRERSRKSWKEIDAARDRGRSGGNPAEAPPASPAARARAAAAAQQYLKTLDVSLFSKPKARAKADPLERAVRKSHGTAELDAACRAYRDARGIPDEASLLSLFLDARDPELQVEILDSLAERFRSGSLGVSSGLRTQLRILAQSSSDEVAERAEALLDSIAGID